MSDMQNRNKAVAGATPKKALHPGALIAMGLWFGGMALVIACGNGSSGGGDTSGSSVGASGSPATMSGQASGAGNSTGAGAGSSTGSGASPSGQGDQGATGSSVAMTGTSGDSTAATGSDTTASGATGTDNGTDASMTTGSSGTGSTSGSASSGPPPKGGYTASWASVDTHLAAPEWFKDAKFGIYFHYGAFTVPAYYSEWYGHYIYDQSANTGSCRTYHGSTYGDEFAVPGWGYNNFVAGGTDKSGNHVQFSPKLVSAGGKLDPDGFATLFVAAGAKFAGPVMEHHDGFSMWDSKVNPWNSVDVAGGPGLNLAKLWTDAFRAKGLKILAAMHHAYHFTGFYTGAPKQTDPKLILFYAQQSSAAENQLWYDKLKEVIDEFQPDILWQDFNLRAVDQAQLLKFLAYYFNQESVWNKEVVTTYKDGEDTNCCMYDYERGGAETLQQTYWLTDDAVSSGSWCYTDKPKAMSLYSSAQILHSLIDHVSKNGNFLLNISPMLDGSLPQNQIDLLNAVGAWLHPFGEAIYSTRAWTIFGEGPTQMGTPMGKLGHPVAGTAQDFRYTRSKDGQTLYAIILGWPGASANVTFKSVTTSAFALGSKAVVMLPATAGATPITLKATQSGSGLTVTMPASQPYTALAYAVRIGPAQATGN